MPAIRQILTKVNSLNGAQKRLGHYLQTDSSALLLSNVGDLARAVGVSKATVVRFAKSLGYKGFPEFRREIQQEMRRKLRAADRMEETFAELDNDENIFAKLIKRDIQLLEETLASGFASGFSQSRGDYLARAEGVPHRSQRFYGAGLPSPFSPRARQKGSPLDLSYRRDFALGAARLYGRGRHADRHRLPASAEGGPDRAATRQESRRADFRNHRLSQLRYRQGRGRLPVREARAPHYCEFVDAGFFFSQRSGDSRCMDQKSRFNQSINRSR